MHSCVGHLIIFANYTILHDLKFSQPVSQASTYTDEKFLSYNTVQKYLRPKGD